MSDLGAFWSRIVDPYGHNTAPAENRMRRSFSDFAGPSYYSPPTTADNVALAEAPRAPLRSVVMVAPQQQEQNGMGGPAAPQAAPYVSRGGPEMPTSPARDIIPNAPQQNIAEIEEQAIRDAIARAIRGRSPSPPDEAEAWSRGSNPIRELLISRQRARMQDSSAAPPLFTRLGQRREAPPQATAQRRIGETLR